MFPTIQATVLQRNAANAYICNPCNGGYGKTLPIPCGTAAITGVDQWATPIKTPYFQGFQYTISDTQPTYDSLPCFKVTNTITNDWYMVLGNNAAYAAACNACCDTSPAPSLVYTPLIDIPSCQETCTTDGTNYDAFFAVPAEAMLGSGKYVARVELNGGVVVQQTFAAGSASIAALVAYLNANATSVGTWSNPADETIRLRTTSKKEVCFIACVKTS